AEAASIVGITKYPGKYDPFTHPDNNKERQETVLYKMYEQGYITKEQYEKAKAEPLNFAKEKATSEVNSKQSYFTDQVIEDVINSLVTEKGYTKQFATSMVYSGGLKIYSTMNKDIQDTMDTVFKDEKNFPKTYGSKQKAQASMTVMDPYTGAVVGIVGGRGEKTVDRGLNRATQTTRSPGSTIKPIAVYAPAIEYNVITEGSVFDDTPLDIADKWPKNYTNKYGGMTTVKDAVEQSINTIATKVLDKLGTERSYNFMKNNLGITSLVDRRVQNGQVKSDINLSPLGLGGLTDGVSVMELTAAYVPFANKGIYVKPYTFTKVEDYQGNVILEKKPEKSIAMSEQTAYIMNDLLQSVVSYGTGTPAKLSGMPTAGKTGTTSDDKDRWFVGYTPYYVGAVWFGFDTPEEINVSGNNPALVLWKRVMSKIHEGKQSRDFYSTQGLTRETVCADSGLLMTDACKSDPRGSREYTAWFKKGTVPTKYCDVHIFADIDTETNMIAGANCPASNRKKVGLLNVKREFPYDIGVTDAQYTYLPIPSGYSYSYNGPVYQNLLPDGTFAGHSEGVDNPMNHLSPGSSATPDNESSDSGAASQTETPSDSGTQSGNTGTATQNDTTTAPSNNSNDNSSSGNSGATKTEEPVVPVVN
ncbi:MAG: penicillin-binding transpeptidase domain-containing protein, partial [Bacillota bacterium]|nr:penicillin-binding transpeptidase domain-containing protein [Bacillota bacterium]